MVGKGRWGVCGVVVVKRPLPVQVICKVQVKRGTKMMFWTPTQFTGIPFPQGIAGSSYNYEYYKV